MAVETNGRFIQMYKAWARLTELIPAGFFAEDSEESEQEFLGAIYGILQEPPVNMKPAEVDQLLEEAGILEESSEEEEVE